ncbi:integrase core domain-containing protein [Thermomonas sp.]|uniref:integrase core domain-containing protein n=4 Tax=Thermomonas TaxID=141948 RepID=UPI00321F7FC6
MSFAERLIKYLAIVDDATHETVAIKVERVISSLSMMRVLKHLTLSRGLRQVIHANNGPEFLGEVFVEWTKTNGMDSQYTQPSKPNQNVYIERSNRTFREELLDQHLFLWIDDIREAVPTKPATWPTTDKATSPAKTAPAIPSTTATAYAVPPAKATATTPTAAACARTAPAPA